jgi:hypothetical protein
MCRSDEGCVPSPPIDQRRVQAGGEDYLSHPFYWFRGGRNMHVHAYSRLGPDRVLLGFEELVLSKIVAFRPSHRMHNLLYIETRADEPSGAYEYRSAEIADVLAERVNTSTWGYFVDEEYGLWNGHPITRTEYDDAAAIIEGRPQRTHGADLRVRYLTPYNLILCSRRHVINQNRFDRVLGELMDRILIGSNTVDQLIKAVERIPIPMKFQVGE